ncbi:Protein CBG26516 [Caenorhabditis briggsae]|uniref:Protein CBG26516 n=1 Tax=Caenorhabditis briggsae TaxID=6238 RepID=B6IIZ9_CAEBR|nr:Protein CBG26516 [Caenorhabditis briggsae]CAR99879.1 Protein CBG26516 [Caenorhabditis briggsae]
MKQLWIRSNGHWVTCDNLMNFDCCYILIERSRLSISDLSSFLRHWRAGGSTCLEWLQLNFEKHTFQKWFDEDLKVLLTDEERECFAALLMDGNLYFMVATVSNAWTV